MFLMPIVHAVLLLIIYTYVRIYYLFYTTFFCFLTNARMGVVFGNESTYVFEPIVLFSNYQKCAGDCGSKSNNNQIRNVPLKSDNEEITDSQVK